MSDVDVKIYRAVATVTLNRSAQRNALTYAMWKSAAQVFARLSSDKQVRAILLMGAGGNFSVGADISEFGQVRATAQQAAQYEVAVDAASEAIADCPKPTIAVLEGYCLGGGCHLAMACDFRIASRSVTFGIPAAKLSIIYGVRSTQRLLALVGLSAAKRILYTAQRFAADEALEMGFADELDDNPKARARDVASQMVPNAPLSISGAKSILTGLSMGIGALDLDSAQSTIDQAADSHDYTEGRKAFLEKRPPKFRGD